MTVFRFEELTWPEVAALPRNLPLVLPLGNYSSWDELPGRLDTRLDVGVLPAIPFGWRGSGLEVRKDVFSALVHNLVGNLLEDGFASVHVVAPEELDLGADLSTLILPNAQRNPDLDGIPVDKVILLPIGHTEQHGYHSPLSTDTIIIEALGRGTAAAAPEDAFCLPAFPYGVSTHRRSFPGTFNVGGRAFEDFWLAVVDRLVAGGCTRFYLMSGHGGNSSFLVNVVKYAGEKYPEIFCATAFLYLSGPQGVAALEAKRQSGLGGMGHACELETSIVLHLRPELVHLERAVDETDFITTPSYYMDWIEGGALTANPPWEDDTRTGAYGAGSLATAEKGRFWLEAAVAEKVGHVAEIHEQYRRRRERRSQRQ
ncbi:MAG TPA: creatininase family protein [Anaerolineales bacterium]|nr:creatininase family protein [Anaerolineales bacterium]